MVYARVGGRAAGALPFGSSIIIHVRFVLCVRFRDTLRNWEMNGLLTVKRKNNGYRVYTDEDIQRLKIIRSLRCANYSLEAIRRLLQQLSKNPNIDIRVALNTPKQTEDIISVCDRLIISLSDAETNAKFLLEMLQEMKILFS